MTTQKAGRKRALAPIATDKAPTVSLQSAITDPEPVPLPEGVAEGMDENVLRSVAIASGFEIHRKRSPRGAMAKVDCVPGKVRTTVYLPVEKRKMLAQAQLETNHSLTSAVEEAIDDWLAKMKVHAPGQ